MAGRPVLSRVRRTVTRLLGLRPRSAPLPFDADWLDHRPGTVSSTYATDRTGTIVYARNSLGYRGPEYDSNARFTLCIVGESFAAGVGVEWKDTFGVVLAGHIASALGLPDVSVQVVNLAISGVSADHCARTVHRQIPRILPDFVVCLMPSQTRIEYFNGQRYQRLNIAGTDPTALEGLAPHVLGFFDLYNPYLGAIGLVKNILLIQSFLAEERIDHVIVIPQGKLNETLLTHDFIQPFAARFDSRVVLSGTALHRKRDKAVDQTHPGPSTHAAFARDMLEAFAAIQRRRGHLIRWLKLRRHIRALGPAAPVAQSRAGTVRPERPETLT